MAWGDLASNQMVSFTDAQSGGFNLNSGQSPVTSNQCMTKNDALTKYALDSSYMSGYASNQLVPKSAWISASSTGTLDFYFLRTFLCGSARLYKNGVLISTLTSTGSYSTSLNAGDTFYASVTLTGSGCIDLSGEIIINSTTRGQLYVGSTIGGTLTSPAFTRQAGEDITINTSTG